MSKAMQLVGIILLGILTLVIMYLMSDVRSTNELDYYLLQEVTEASMYDAVDYSYYRETGLLKVDRDMFLENFNRRFAESVKADRNYEIKIIDFNETPPKVSIEVKAPTVASIKGEVALIDTNVNGIIETIYDDFVYSKGGYGLDNYDDEAPKIEVSDPVRNEYTITMTDNYILDKYAVVEPSGSSNVRFTADDFKAISNWNNISGYVNTHTIKQTIPEGKNGIWVVAIDRGGLWTAVPVTDMNPFISNWAYNPSNEGTISVTFKDDRGLDSYTVQPVKCNGNAVVDSKGQASCSGNWIVDNAYTTLTSKIDNVKISDDGYYMKNINNIDVSKANYYAITVKDSKGQISKQKIVQGNRKHEIAITYKVIGTKLEAAITDTYGDLAYYKITNSSEIPTNWEPATYGDKIKIKQDIDTSKNNYIHAKDSAGKTFNVQVLVKKELLSSPYTIKDGCSGVWTDSSNKTQGCYSDVNNQTWTHNDNTSKEFTINTNDYSKVKISVSDLNFKTMGPYNSCPSEGDCKYMLRVVIGNRNPILIKSWGWNVGKYIYDDVSNDILGTSKSGTITLDFNTLGIKNSGEQTLKIETFTNIYGLVLFSGNVNQITLES